MNGWFRDLLEECDGRQLAGELLDAVCWFGGIGLILLSMWIAFGGD